jgi:hypothetical protein
LEEYGKYIRRRDDVMEVVVGFVVGVRKIVRGSASEKGMDAHADLILWQLFF